MNSNAKWTAGAVAGIGATVAIAVALAGPGLAPTALPSAEPSAPAEPRKPLPDTTDVVAVAKPAEAKELAEITGEPVEVVAKRTETTRVFALPSGEWMEEIQTAPSQVIVSGDGSDDADWADVNTKLEIAEDGKVRPRVYAADLWLSPGGRDGVLLESAIYDSDAAVSLLWDGALPSPTLDGSRAVYADVWPGVDVVIDVFPLGFEQHFVFKTDESLDRLDDLFLGIEAEGAEIVPSPDGGFELIAPGGESVGHVPTAFAWDADEDALRSHPVLAPWSDEPFVAESVGGIGAPIADDSPVPLRVEGGASRARVFYDVDLDWARSPERTLPLVVDPSATLGSSSWNDMYVRSAYPTSSFSTQTELFIGSVSNYGRYRTIVNFQTQADLGGKEILDAEFKIYNHHSWSCTNSDWYVYEVNAQYSSVTWNSQPSSPTYVDKFSETRGYSSSCSDGYIYADSDGFTDVVQGWADGTDNTRGIFLVAADEGSNYSWKRFYSRQYSNSSKRPKITYVYNTYPDAPSTLTADDGVVVSPVDLAADETATLDGSTVTVLATVTDDDVDDVRALFDIYQSFPGSSERYLVASQVPGSEVSSGSASQLDLGPWLTTGSTYEIHAWAWDGRVISRKALPDLDADPAETVGWFTYEGLPSTTDDVPTWCDDQTGPVYPAPQPSQTYGPSPSPYLCPTPTPTGGQ